MVGVVGSSPIAPTIPMRARFFPLLLVFLSTAAAAQYPSRPIHLIVPIPPGGIGTIRWMGREGYCAAAAVERKTRRRGKKRARMGMVGAIGLEPTTPTMSR